MLRVDTIRELADDIVRELEWEMIKLAHDLYVAQRLSGDEILEITAEITAALTRVSELLAEKET